MKNILKLLCRLALLILRLRYKIEFKGLADIKPDDRPMLFLPNHPALIDPIIVMVDLYSRFKPRPLADQKQVDRLFIRDLMKLLRAVIIPDPATSGRRGKELIERGVAEIIKGLRQGDSVLLYPAGRLSRGNREEIGANSAVESVVKQLADVRIVLVRTTGLWGSGFSWAQGRSPLLVKYAGLSTLRLLVNGVFFMPRRRVVVELTEPADFPYDADRVGINRYLEDFYNQHPQQNIMVPYYWWEGRESHVIPEHHEQQTVRDTSIIPEATTKLVRDKLAELSGEHHIREDDRLAADLGMDSLVLVEFAGWLEEEFGLAPGNLEGLRTVADCILAAGGIMPPMTQIMRKPVSTRWFRDRETQELLFGAGDKITELFLARARKTPDQVILADQISGEKTYRQLVMAVHALLPEIAKLDGERVGIMLPASVSGAIVYLTVLFAGKTPVLVNWTTGAANMSYSLRSVGAHHVITAGALMSRVREQGVDLDGMDVNWVKLEQIAAGMPLTRKLGALARSRMSWAKLRQAAVGDTAAILFTSGSESRPKSVPLTHANFLANGRDFGKVLSLRGSDRLLGILPIFHSLGLAGTVIMPLCLGLKTVYWPNPTEGAQLGKMVHAYKVTTFITTPTFLNGMLRTTDSEELTSLRLVFSGAEKCPEHVFADLREKCPAAVLCEGYGVTECSPVISVNQPDDPRPGTIGKMLPSMEHLLIHPDTGQRVAAGAIGRLLVRGPNVFAGYLGNAKSPFVNVAGKEWYDTGDLAREEGGVLVFAGRLKRFVKIGGEMISLPAIEEALSRGLAAQEDPQMAVISTPDEEYPELVLMTVRDIERRDINRMIRDAGLSALHNIRRVIKIAEIPILGTGKTDYRRLNDIYLTQTSRHPLKSS